MLVKTSSPSSARTTASMSANGTGGTSSTSRAQLLDVDVGQEVGPRREELAQLDEGRAELLQRQAEAARALARRLSMPAHADLRQDAAEAGALCDPGHGQRATSSLKACAHVSPDDPVGRGGNAAPPKRAAGAPTVPRKVRSNARLPPRGHHRRARGRGGGGGISTQTDPPPSRSRRRSYHRDGSTARGGKPGGRGSQPDTSSVPFSCVSPPFLA